MKLKTILIGTTPMANKLISLLQQLNCVDLVGVINLNPRYAVNKSNYNSMLQLLREYPSKLFYAFNINDKQTIKWIKKRKPDLIIQAGWSQIFKKEILEIPKLFCIGIHSAPLPEGRGGAILNWKLIEGGGKWGCSLFKMDEGIDTGAILDFEPFTLEDRDDIRTAYLKADRVALKMIKRTLPKIVNNTYFVKLQEGSGLYYSARTPKDGKMKFSWSAKKILNYVRALTHPYPGAYFETKLGKLIVWKVQGNSEDKWTGRKSGTIIDINSRIGIFIQVNKSALWLTEITPPNDVEMWANSWAVEQGLKVGDNLR